MKQVISQLVLGFFLIAGASVILLLSDLNSRVGGSNTNGLVRVAVIQHNTQPIFDAGVHGIVVGLAEKGFRHPETIELRKLNPFADTNLANAIAREVTDGSYDLILTVTTPSLQAIANANRHRHIRHVFALVSDPVATGTGVLSMDSLEHPPYMTGYGTRLPAESIFRVAREINPSLRVVGTLWNHTEVNSESQLRDARKICEELRIRLIEVNVDTTGGVAEAAASLISRGIDALFIPGDVTVLGAVDNVHRIAYNAGIPTFSVFPSEVLKGALFAVGADYFAVGRKTGHLAAEILRGHNPAEIPVINYLPEQIVLSEKARLRLRHPEQWVFPDSLLERAFSIMAVDGTTRQLQPDQWASIGQSEPE